MVDGYSGFLFMDDDGMPLVAMHWEHRFNHMVKRVVKMIIPTGAIQPVFYCPGFLSMVFYIKKETALRVFRVVNWRAFYYFSTTFDGRDKSRFATKSEA